MSTPGKFIRRSAGGMIALLEGQQRPSRRELQTSSEAQTRIRQKAPPRTVAKRAAEWHVRSMCMHLQSSMAAAASARSRRSSASAQCRLKPFSQLHAHKLLSTLLGELDA